MEIPSFSQPSVEGKVSWFGGPNDSTDSGHTASGGTTKEPGIAVYNRQTLGGYWRVTANNGKTAVLKQTDLGPAPFTGRKIDVTYSALGHFGYHENNFPTNSTFKAQYIGKQLPHGTSTGPQMASASSVAPRFNEAGYLQAKQQAETNAALKSLQKYTNTAGLGLPIGSSRPPLQSAFSSPGKEISGSVAHAPPSGTPFIPKGAKFSLKRVDAGQDLETNPGGALVAPGDGEVIAVKSDPSGFGPDYPVVRFTSGPMAGKSIYLGHTDAALKMGSKFRAGDTIARTSKQGHNAPPGWAEIGEASALGQGNQGQGAAIAPYFRKK